MAKQNKESKKLSSLVKAFKHYYPSFIISIVLLIISIACTVLIPTYISKLTKILLDAINVANGVPVVIDSSATMQVIALLITFIAASFISSYASAFILNTCIQKFSRDLREMISQKINKLPLNYFDTRQTGDILSVITNDVDTLATSLQNCVTILFNSILLLACVVVTMFISSWQLALVVIASLPLILILLFVTFKIAGPLFNKTQETIGEVNGIVEENFTGQLVIKAFNSEERKIDQFEKSNKTLGKILFKSQSIGGAIEPLMQMISFLTNAAVLIVGGLLVIGNATFLATVTGFLVYTSLFQEPLAQIGTVGSTIQMGLAANKRVFDFLEEEELVNDSEKPVLLDHSQIKGAVVFDHVGFGYDPNKLTIKDFNQVIQPGMKVAIIGPTGAGKTTLVNLLMRFYETTKGDITIDGVSIHDMKRSELRDMFGMILQETWVINGTLRENIVYNLKNVEEDRLNQILEEVNLTHFVETLPNGLDTVIKKDSALSAGQKQLVTIARAMAENAPMMILDEATSNVDTRTEILIQNAMDKLTKGRTSFVIAHRLSTIKNADLIIVMKDGNVVETGNHDSLMALQGLYSEIYNSQFQK